MRAYLIDDRRQCHEIGVDRSFKIGRQKGCDVVIPDDLVSPSISREHAIITANGGAFSLRDFNSSNGTFVNGRPLGLEPVALKNGDSVQFGNVKLTFRIRKSYSPYILLPFYLIAVAGLTGRIATRAPCQCWKARSEFSLRGI